MREGGREERGEEAPYSSCMRPFFTPRRAISHFMEATVGLVKTYLENFLLLMAPLIGREVAKKNKNELAE